MLSSQRRSGSFALSHSTASKILAQRRAACGASPRWISLCNDLLGGEVEDRAVASPESKTTDPDESCRRKACLGVLRAIILREHSKRGENLTALESRVSRRH
jgi:hypothetical protein